MVASKKVREGRKYFQAKEQTSGAAPQWEIPVVVDSEDEEDASDSVVIQILRHENQVLNAELEKAKDKALHLARTLLLVHGLVKPLIDRTVEAAVLCKEATRDRDGTLKQMREFYKENGAKVQEILTPGAKAVNKLHAKYLKLADHLCQYQNDDVKTPEQLMDLVCAIGTTEKSGR